MIFFYGTWQAEQTQQRLSILAIDHWNPRVLWCWRVAWCVGQGGELHAVLAEPPDLRPKLVKLLQKRFPVGTNRLAFFFEPLGLVAELSHLLSELSVLGYQRVHPFSQRVEFRAQPRSPRT